MLQGVDGKGDYVGLGKDSQWCGNCDHVRERDQGGQVGSACLGLIGFTT